MRDELATLRAFFPTLVFTHRVTALRELKGWDWIGAWNKPLCMAGLNSMPIMPHWEPIFFYGIKGRTDMRRGFDVFNVNPVPITEHPCPKPVPLFREMISRFADDVVIFDPFMGSGTTLRAAKDLGRRAVGCDISEAYCEIAAKRLGQEVLDFGAAS